jgi:TonB-linked SusC/RagA family outer membrane protein
MKKAILIIVLAALCHFFKANAQNTIKPPVKYITGKVTDEQGVPLPGATVKTLSNSAVSIADRDGKFALNNVPANGSLTVSFIGFQSTIVSIPTNPTNEIVIQLKADASSLNEVQVIGYGTTTKRLNTGSVSTLTASSIESQPVTNVLSALSGRMPGVFVQTTNGMPGGAINIQIRGKGSITAGTNPLYIIDGVPFESSIVGPTSLLASGTVSGAINPLNSLNPSDIESISVLKDADATSIYGSRGTNGVILITTKKGKSGKASINFTRGISRSANLPKMMDLNDYLAIRKEAFANDKLTPTVATAPDLLQWNQSQHTNWSKYLFDNTAQYTDVQAAINGGDKQTFFNLSGNYHQEGNIITDQADYTRGSLHANISHYSSNRRFLIQFSNSLVLDNNKSPNVQNATSGILLPPNFPLTDNNGQYVWRGTNPLAEMNSSTSAKTDNLISNLTVGYDILRNLTFKVSAGYNKINIDQIQLYPVSSLLPGSVNYAQYGKNNNQSYIAEPQLTFKHQFKKSSLNLLLGGTESQFLRGSNYSNEELLENISSAATIDSRTNYYTNYKYLSGFIRATYNINDKYIVNGTFRRDGSSRFGVNNRFGDFGSLGAAWLFSEERWLKDHLPVLSFGKLRGSYGTTGNDQIPDYQFLSTYGSSGFTYQGTSTLRPARIDNTDFHWETTKKLEFALELGWLNNRILLNVSYYRNRSTDQLVQYNLPRITGFASYQANLPAVVQNTGWEIELATVNIEQNNFRWSTNFNTTIPGNKLVSFENFSSSSYAQTLQVGYDITRIYGYQFLGVDPATGRASYADQNGTASSNPYFFSTIGKQTPDLYGGLTNTFSYGNFTLDIFFQFAKQMAVGGLRAAPGLLINNYAFTNDRWQQPGDISNIPKASTINDSFYATSSANFYDASYIRLKNISLGFALPKSFTDKIKASRINVFVRGQNLLTFWNNDVPLSDPESGALSVSTPRNFPPVKSLVCGLEFTF